MLKKLLFSFPMAAFAAAMSGCAVMGGVITGTMGSTMAENEAKKLTAVVEVGEIKLKRSANITILKTAKVSSVVYEKDMATPNVSPSQNDIKVNNEISNEAKRYFGITNNEASPVTVRLKTYLGEIDPWGWSIRYYLNNTERNTLTTTQQYGIRKLVNTHFVLEQGGDIVLEVHGLWAGGNNSDEIAGAKQLANAMAGEILKKLNSPAPPSVTEAKKE